ncbi:MAG: HEPN domain-containing protein [Bacteroidales bacterium]|nr:HEPN domain-containing protein [Bacteroidales bacterium]MCF8402531.1 HEPN domain-containing protein [Bacteroidales bacterium]
MKPITKEWLIAAEDDLLSAKKLVTEKRLTNIVAFHCQQCIEKGLKAFMEERGDKSVKSHDLLRLKDLAGLKISEKDYIFLATINEIYTDSRYPGDMGLMPHGKPTLTEVNEFILFSEKLLDRIKQEIGY